MPAYTLIFPMSESLPVCLPTYLKRTIRSHLLVNGASQSSATELTKLFGSGGIRTHASEETGALNQRLRPLGHATTVL